TAMVLTRCAPDPGAYNVYRLSVSVWDSEKPTAHAFSNWTFTAEPPEAVSIHPEYNGTFYTGISFSNTFSVYAQIDNAAVTGMTGTLGTSAVLTFSHQNGSNYWWQATYDMGNSETGALLQVVASTSSWTENATLAFNVVETPSFLLTFIDFPGVVQTSNTTGPGPFNLGYTIVQSISISLSQLFNFTLPSQVPLIQGIYNLLPSVVVSISETSSGTVSLSGTLIETPPAITFGAFSLTISASLQLIGTMSVQASNGVEEIDWVSASLTIAIQGDFKGNFPIYGYSFDILGNTITIGFSLTVDLIPAVALEMVMVPASSNNTSIAAGMNFMVTQLIGSLSLPLQVAINFGIGVASVSAGGTIAVAVNFEISPPPFAWSNIWVNGTVQLQLQILFWSTMWNLTGPATIYHGMPSLPERPQASTPASAYNNGSGAVWQVDPRAYNTTGYDHLSWTPSETAGVAISDIYPHAAPTAASDFGGANLFYTDDRVDQPVQRGLTFSGLDFNASSGAAVPIPTPSDPGFLLSAPQSATLPDGSVAVVWDALPLNEAVGSSPAAVNLLALHGAIYYPSNQSWGPVRDFTTSGVAQSYALDTSGAAPIVVALVSPGIIAGATTPQGLVTYSFLSGAMLSTTTVTGYGEVVSARSEASGSSPGYAILQQDGGNFTEVQLGSGAIVALAYSAPANGSLVEERFVPATDPVLLLRYRQPTGGLVVLYDTTTGAAADSVRLPGDATDAEAAAAGSSFILYVSNGTGWSGEEVAASGSETPLASVSAAHIGRFGMSQVGGSILLFAVVPGSGATAGQESLFVAEVGAGLAPIAAGAPSSGGGTPRSPSSAGPFNVLLYVGLPLIAAAAVLVIVVIVTRRRRGPSGAAPPMAGTPTSSPPSPAPPPG
ncbi:MAG: hypothetical protein L3K17_10250, partial [Thermoplasmata archaeon]|nr:hypothetical protein [Thermoplasmata archaeon]